MLPEPLKGKLRLPLIGAPMFLVSGPELVIEQCKAGVVGSFPALNARPESVLEDWLGQIQEELASAAENPGAVVAPFAVNQICHPSNTRLQHDVELCVKYKVPIVITSLSPPAEIVQAVHSYGGLVFHDVVSVRHAEKAAAQGVDGLILVAAGAGGHAGTLSPFALVNEVRSWFEGAIILSGAMANGSAVAGAIAMGADLAYMGTGFIATNEAHARPEYKQMLVDCVAKDIVYSSYFTGVKGNYLSPSIKEAGMDPDNLPDTDKSAMNVDDFEKMDAKAWKDIWGAGQGLGSIDGILPVSELVDRIEKEYEQRILELQKDNWGRL